MSSDNQFTALGPTIIGFQTNGTNIDRGADITGKEFGVRGSGGKAGAAGVGVAVGRAVRTSIVAVNVIDLFLSMAIWGSSTTVRLAG